MMEGLLPQSVEKYLEAVGKDTKRKKENRYPQFSRRCQETSCKGIGGRGRQRRCPLAIWRSHQCDPKHSDVVSSAALESDVNPAEAARGGLAPRAASVLVKLLYAARIAQFDLLFL